MRTNEKEQLAKVVDLLICKNTFGVLGTSLGIREGKEFLFWGPMIGSWVSCLFLIRRQVEDRRKVTALIEATGRNFDG